MAKYVNDTVAQAIANDIQKNRVLLGAFDTVDTSNANYNLITRNTVILYADKIEWEYSSFSGRYYKQLSGIVVPADDNTLGQLVSSNYAIRTANQTSSENETIGIDMLGEVLIKSSSVPKGVIQIKSSSSYTEKVIKGVPILNLDQNGANWLRSEWEKGLQLLSDTTLVVGGINENNVPPTLVPAQTNRITFSKIIFDIKPNKQYTISNSGGKQIALQYYNSSKSFISSSGWQNNNYTFTTPSNAYFIAILFRNSDNSDLSVSDVGQPMLNEGDHPYPYQPYNGAIVHEKDLDTIKTDISNLQSDLSDLSNEVDDHSDLLAELKSLVYDNQYPAVKKIKFNTFTALPNSIDGDKLIFGAGGDMTNIDGMSVVVNQKITNGNFVNSNNWLGFGVSTISVSNNTLTCQIDTSSGIAGFTQDTGTKMVNGHKYLLSRMVKTNAETTVRGGITNIIDTNIETEANKWTIFNTIFTSNTDIQYQLNCYVTQDSNATELQAKLVYCVDLTQWFGSNDNIPSDLLSNPSLFTSKYWKGSLEYDTGHIESAKPKAIVSRGVNIFDEEVESGKINISTGALESDNDYIRSKNFIKVNKNTDYCFHRVSNGETDNYIIFYNENYEYLDYWQFDVNRVLNTSGATYVKFYIKQTTYNNDICINISNSAINGTYYPYIEPKRYLINVGNNNSINGVNTIKDIMGVLNTDRKIGKVDLGTLSYSYESDDLTFYAELPSNAISPITKGGQGLCVKYKIEQVDYQQFIAQDKILSYCNSNISSAKRVFIKDTTYNDATAFKNSLSGVYLYYELATPTTEENPQDAILPTNIEIQKGGSLEIESDLPCDITLEVAVSKVY